MPVLSRCTEPLVADAGNVHGGESGSKVLLTCLVPNPV